MASLGFNVSEFVFHLRPIIIFLFFISALRLRKRRRKAMNYGVLNKQFSQIKIMFGFATFVDFHFQMQAFKFLPACNFIFQSLNLS